MATTKKTAAKETVKKTAVKAAEKETKTTAAAAEVKAPEAVKEIEAAKKAPAVKKPSCAMKVSLNIQYAGGNYSDKDIIDAIKAAYKEEGNEESIKTLEVYVQPENGVAYYVINGVGGDKKIVL